MYSFFLDNHITIIVGLLAIHFLYSFYDENFKVKRQNIDLTERYIKLETMRRRNSGRYR